MVQWITHFENAQWRVESNAVVSDVNRFFTWEKSFIRVTWKVAGEIFCYIDGEKYNFYNAGEQVILEITDIVRSMFEGTVRITDYDDEFIWNVGWERRRGQRAVRSNVAFLPPEIPYSGVNNLAFFLELSYKYEGFDSLGAWKQITGDDWITNPYIMPVEDNYTLRKSVLNLTDTLRVADTTNFEINETSGAYGFGYRTIDLKKGESYKFSANGNSEGASVGATLMVYIYYEESGVWKFFREIEIDSSTDITSSVTFEAPETRTYTIASFYFPNGAPAGIVTVNWYKVELISGAQTRLIDLPCTNEHILFEWTGRFGVKKSWWFRKESVISEATKTINLQTMDSGFNTLKDKNTNLIISHRNADNLTQHYLSDIVLSDEVFCYPDETAESKLQVRVETNSFEVGLNNRDIVLTINKDAYDTI